MRVDAWNRRGSVFPRPGTSAETEPPLARPAGSVVAVDDVDSGRGGEREGIGREVRLPPDVVEREQRRLAELIVKLHAAKLPAGEREPDAGERGVLGLRLERERVNRSAWRRSTAG